MNAPTTAPLVLASQDGAVLKLTLNRGNARNALSVGLMSALQGALDDAAKDQSVRVVVIAADGPALPHTDMLFRTEVLVLSPPTSNLSVPPAPTVVTPLKKPRFACRAKGAVVGCPGNRRYMKLIQTEPGSAPFPAAMLPRVFVDPTVGRFRFGVAVVLAAGG